MEGLLDPATLLNRVEIGRGMLKAASHRAALRLAFPAEIAERWFPNLYPANAGSIFG